MKKKLLLLPLMICLLTGFINKVKAQTTLASGDISFVGFNSALAARDGFAFVTWINLSAGTVIKFTDDGFNSGSYSNTSGNVRALEQIFTWTATSAIPAGTVITIEGDGNSNTTANIGTVAVTAADGTLASFMTLANTGDNFFAFQGSFTTPNSTSGTISGTPLFLVQYQGTGSSTGFLTTGTTGTGNSYIPSDLVGYTLFFGSNAVAGEYTGPRTGLTVPQYKAAVNNISNWTTYTGVTGATTYNTSVFSLGAPPVITGQPSGKTICAASNTSFSVTATSALTYQWQVNTGSGFADITNTPPYTTATTSSLTITGVIAGMNGYTYRCNVSNATGTTASSSATLTVPNFTASTSQTNIACNAGSSGAASVTATGGSIPYTYSWSPSGGTAATATGLTAGAYTCTITDNAGCKVTKNFTITQPSALAASTSQTNIACYGGASGAASVTMSGGTPSYTYSWSPSGGTAATATGLVAGAYVCTITDANGCTLTKNFSITQPSALAASTSQTNIACYGGASGAASVTMSGGTPSYTYSWSPSGGTAATATGLVAGAYVCTITDANGCTLTKNFTVTQPSVLAASTSQTNLACNGGASGAASVTMSGGIPSYTYSWAPSGGTAATATGLTPGNYVCTITDANGCTLTKNVTITQPSALAASTSQTNLACYGGASGAVSVTMSGGTPSYMYSWSPSGGTAATATGLVAGAYVCTITDANGCTITKNFTITQPAALIATTSQTNVSCNGGSNGSAGVTMSGGTPSYTYSWSPSGGTAATATGLTPGNYVCTITDANGCTLTKNFTITQPSALAASTSQTNLACNGGASGAASVTMSGGIPSYTYSWAPSGGTAATATGLTPGNYVCTITDANGCTLTKNFTITQPVALTATTSQTNVSCNGGSNGSAGVTVSGGTGSKTYSWAPSGGTAATATGLTPGNYVCTITDANGCTLTKNFTITQPSALTASTSQTNIACNGGASGTASVTMSGGTPSYTYSWSPSGGTAATATGLVAGAYVGTITDANGCTLTKNVAITQAGFTPGTTTYALPATYQSVTKPVTTGNYVTSACELIGSVISSGANPVTGNATTKVWVESSVPATGGIPFVQRHYEITPVTNAATSTGTITLYFSQAEFNNFNAQSPVDLPSGPSDAAGKANLRISKYSGVSSDVSGLPATYSSSPLVIDPADNYIVWNAAAGAWEITFDVNGFSGFIVQAALAPLPVTWASFTTQQQGKSARLNWSTASEQNTKTFTVQHSINGTQWTSIASIQAAGFSTNRLNYSYLHTSPASGINYYRILLSDVDGKSKYSEIKTVKLFTQNEAFSVAVNPVTDGLLKIKVQQKATFSLFDLNGKLLWKKQLSPGLQNTDVSRYAKGVYLLKADATSSTIMIQ